MEARDATSTTGDQHSGAGVTTRHVIELERVSKTFGSGRLSVDALKAVDLSIPRGEFVVILGPSGSGKTTLLNVVGGIEPPTAGTVIVDGEEIHRLNPDQSAAFRRHHVGFVFQFFNLIPTLTAAENVELIADLAGSDAAARSESALRSVGLHDKAARFPSELSGGEQQRVAIARALAKEPAIFLCDEPTGALDLATGRQVLGLLGELTRAEDRTVMLVTHNSAIARMADRVLHMRSGEIVADEINPTPLAADQLEW